MKRSALGIDHGTKRTGFAVVDPLRVASHALETFEGAGDSELLIEHITSLLAERDVGTLVVGIPYNMDGTLGGRAQDVLAFAHRLQSRFQQLDVVLQDERLSSKEAESRLAEAGVPVKKRRAQRDGWSALVILRDWLESGEPLVPLPPIERAGPSEPTS